MPPDPHTRRTPGGDRGLVQIAEGDDTGDRTHDRVFGAPLLGRWLFLPTDPVAGAHHLADLMGGRVAAVSWMRTALAELERSRPIG